jgi:hypothetical protein
MSLITGLYVAAGFHIRWNLSGRRGSAGYRETYSVLRDNTYIISSNISGKQPSIK